MDICITKTARKDQKKPSVTTRGSIIGPKGSENQGKKPFENEGENAHCLPVEKLTECQKKIESVRPPKNGQKPMVLCTKMAGYL